MRSFWLVVAFFGLFRANGTEYVNFLDSEMDLMLLQSDQYDTLNIAAIELEWTYENGADSFTHLYAIEQITYFSKVTKGFLSFYGEENVVEGYFDVSGGDAALEDKCPVNGLCMAPGSEIYTKPSDYNGTLFEVDFLDSIASINFIEVFLDSKLAVGYHFQISYSIGFTKPLSSEITWFDQAFQSIDEDTDFETVFSTSYENDYALGSQEFYLNCRNFTCEAYSLLSFDASDIFKEEFPGELLQIHYNWSVNGTDVDFWNPYVNYVSMFYDPDACDLFDIDEFTCLECKEGFEFIEDPSEHPFCELEGQYYETKAPLEYSMGNTGEQLLRIGSQVIKRSKVSDEICLVLLDELAEGEYGRTYKRNGDDVTVEYQLKNDVSQCQFDVIGYDVYSNTDKARLQKSSKTQASLSGNTLSVSLSFNQDACSISKSFGIQEDFIYNGEPYVPPVQKVLYCQIALIFMEGEVPLYTSEVSFVELYELWEDEQKIMEQGYFDNITVPECRAVSCITQEIDIVEISFLNSDNQEVDISEIDAGDMEFSIKFQADEGYSIVPFSILPKAAYGVSFIDDDLNYSLESTGSNSFQLNFFLWRGMDFIYYFVLEILDESDNSTQIGVISIYGNTHGEYYYYDYTADNITHQQTTHLNEEELIGSEVRDGVELVPLLIILFVLLLTVIVICVCGICTVQKKRQLLKETQKETVELEAEYAKFENPKEEARKLTEE